MDPLQMRDLHQDGHLKQMHDNKIQYYTEQFRTLPNGECTAIVLKCGSRSIIKDAGREGNRLRKRVDPVIMYCRHPLERLVSSWSFITSGFFPYIPTVPDNISKVLISEFDFNNWVQLALKYKNPHWMRVSEAHPSWRTYILRRLIDYPGTHINKGSWQNNWKEYYNKDTKILAFNYYAEDIEIWNKCIKLS